MQGTPIYIDDLKSKVASLKAGDVLLLSGTVYTARDAAHARIVSAIRTGKATPFPLKNAVIYYTGPTPKPEHMPIGSCGPTTSTRMDSFTPTLLEHGLIGMIGKGDRKQEVYDSIIKNGAIYFSAIGGAGAIAAKKITCCDEVAYQELGCESVKRLVMKDFPVVVAIDTNGNSIFKTE